MHDELLDLVDNTDTKIGTIWRAEYDRLEAEDLGYIRAVEMFLVNEDGEFWIPKRTANKRIAPNGLDYSAAGHVSSRETYIEAMIKETSEELNLELAESDLEFVTTIGPDTNRYIRKLYVHRLSVTPTYNPDDFVSASWITPDELILMLDSGVLAKDSLREAVLITRDYLDE